MSSHEPRGGEGRREEAESPATFRVAIAGAGCEPRVEGPRLRGRVARMGKSMDRRRNFRCLSLAGPTQQFENVALEALQLWPHPSPS
jgi:hypothetical protein